MQTGIDITIKKITAINLINFLRIGNCFLVVLFQTGSVPGPRLLGSLFQNKDQTANHFHLTIKTYQN